MHDYHVHSNYSDGDFLHRMVSAAKDAGLEGIGIADHCPISSRDSIIEWRDKLGFNLNITYERRRQAIKQLREEKDIRIYDAAEVDYHPDDEDEIEAFLDQAGFDYAVGSIHELRGHNIHTDYFETLSDKERQEAVDEYFDIVVSLIKFEAFEILAHPDIIERNDALRGIATEEQYESVAMTLASSSTVPEINAGRIHSSYGEFHPNPAFLSILEEYDVKITIGSDAHAPSELRERIPDLRTKIADTDLTVTTLDV